MPDGEIYLRVHSNTGGGFFSQEWIALQDIMTFDQNAGKARTYCFMTFQGEDR
jgi:hypothetical protein